MFLRLLASATARAEAIRQQVNMRCRKNACRELISLLNGKPKPAISRILSVLPELAELSNHLSSPLITLGVKRTTFYRTFSYIQKVLLVLAPGQGFSRFTPISLWDSPCFAKATQGVFSFSGKAVTVRTSNLTIEGYYPLPVIPFARKWVFGLSSPTVLKL